VALRRMAEEFGKKKRKPEYERRDGRGQIFKSVNSKEVFVEKGGRGERQSQKWDEERIGGRLRKKAKGGVTSGGSKE